MPRTITVGGVSLSYLEQNESAKPLVFFFHGNSSTAQSWQHQLNSSELAPYHLIAFDLPAHGASSAAPDYSFQGLGQLLAEAVNTLAAGAPFSLIGFSMANNFIAEMLRYDCHPAAIAMIGPTVIGGEHTIDKLSKFRDDPNPIFTDEPEEWIVHSFYQDSFHVSADVDPYVRGFYEVRDKFRSSLLQSLVEGKISDEISLLEQFGKPVLVIFGQQEKLLEPEYLQGAPFAFWKSGIHLVPNAGHFAHIDNPEAVNRLLAQYLDEQFTATRALQPSAAGRTHS